MSEHIDLDELISEHTRIIETLYKMVPDIERVAALCISVIENGGKIIFAGNGGSAADAQHLSAELTGRFMLNRRALPALAISTDTSALTAIGNDFGYENVFCRQLEGIHRNGDLFIAISTSGNSANLLKAVEFCLANDVHVVGLLGGGGGKLGQLINDALIVKSEQTARIQEAHIFIGHCICQIVEKHFAKFGNE